VNEYGTELASTGHLITQSYQRYSIVRHATANRTFQDIDRGLHFENISVSEVVPEEWFGNPAICPEPFLYDMGRNLAIAEENYLIRMVRENLAEHPVDIHRIRSVDIRNVVESFVSEHNTQPILLIPAQLSIPLITEAEGLDFVDNQIFFRIRPMVSAHLILTSKYVGLSDMLLMDRTFGILIYKLGNYDSLSIEVIRLELGRLRITAAIEVAYRIDRRNAARFIHVASTA
jgi:hypothetical protein